MPRKIKTPASVSQDRENQRRSRARRRDYVQDLEARVRQYENAGVQATVEMQRAARAVEAENRALRSMLGMYGLSPAEIDERVRSLVGVVAPPPLVVRTGGSGGARGGGNVMMTNDSSVTSSSSVASSQPTSVISPTTTDSTPIDPQPSPPVSKCCPKTSNSGCSTTNDKSTNTNKGSCAATAAKRNSIVSTMEKPCHEAAMILAELGSQADQATIRRSLGCIGDEECFVKNTDLMRIIERGV